jgi:hypothetical protein
VLSRAGRLLGWVAKFAIVFFILTILNEIVWDKFVAGILYNCTDPVFGYLTPDTFVHQYAGMAVRVVPRINPNDSMSAGDSIKEGWTIPRLWALWFAFFGTSVGISIALARLPWRPQPLQRPERP